MALRLRAPSLVSLAALYGKRQRSLYDHQKWAREYLQLLAPTKEDLDQLPGVLDALAAETPATNELVRSAMQWLYRQKRLLPHDRALRAIASAAAARAERQAIKIVKKALPCEQWDACVKAVLASREGSKGTVLEWLKRPPRRHSMGTLDQASAKICFLKGLGAHEWHLDGLHLARQHVYAQQLVNQPPGEIKRRASDSQMLQIVCFLRIALLELTDAYLYLADRRTSDLVRQAQNKVVSKQARSAAEYRRCLSEIQQIAADNERSLSERMSAVKAIVDALGDLRPRAKAALTRDALIQDEVRVRTLLGALDAIQFSGSNDEPALEQLKMVRKLRDEGATELPEDAGVKVGKVWRQAVEDEDRNRALRALQVSAITSLRKSLRRGTVWVEHSLSFRERDEMLISRDDWERDRERLAKAHGLPLDVKAFLEPQLALLEAGLKALDEANVAGAIRIDEDGTVHVPAIEALDQEVEPKKTRELLYKEVGDVQLPDLLLEMDAQTNFSEVLLGRRAYDDAELLSLYGGLLAHGSEIDAKGVAAMIPGLTSPAIAAAMKSLERHGRLERANRRVVEFMNRHPITKQWGDGRLASADMMSLDASRHLWNARIDPRRRTFATGIYSHVLDTYAMGYVQPVVLNTRQNGPAIEGVVQINRFNQQALLKLAVDTHGYSFTGTSVAKLLGFDVCVRLRDLAERRLFAPGGVTVPKGVEHVMGKRISLKVIEEHWDELLRWVASVRSGRVSANWVMQRLGSASAGEPVYLAAHELGRLLRSIFLCDYFTLPDFRREMHRILNRGERVHVLQRTVYYGKVAPQRGRRRDELFAISGSHALLTNLVMAWNTHRLQQTVERWRKLKRPIDEEWFASVGPTSFAHINFRGTFRFGLERYRALLIIDRKSRRAA